MISKGFDEVFSKFDLLLGPTTPTTAFKAGERINDPLAMYLEDIYTVSANIAGLPALNIPCGFDRDNMPIGLQLTGKAFSESLLIQAGYTFEQNSGFHLCRPDI